MLHTVGKWGMFVAVVLLLGTAGCRLTPKRPVKQPPSPPKQQYDTHNYTPTRISVAQNGYPYHPRPQQTQAVTLVANTETAIRQNQTLDAQFGISSPELYKAWQFSAAQQDGKSGNIYQLVSDVQPNDGTRTPPPATEVRLLPQQPQPSATAQPRSASILPFGNIGNNLTKEFRPSNDRKWSQNHAVLQTATFQGNQVTIHNVRYSRYNSADDYKTTHYDATFNLDAIRSIDLVVVPFRGMPRVAHIESSFGFADGKHIGMSIEARYEDGEQYDPLGAALRQFELVYVFADERDMIRLGTDVHKNDVLIYKLNFTPQEVRAIFVDALQRANKLAAQPEFYRPLLNSCVTNLIAHINKARPNAVPRDYRTLVPGILDRYFYDLKLVDTQQKTFKETKEQAKVNWLVDKYGDLEYFSAGIRQSNLK